MDKVNQKMKKFNLRGVLDGLRSSVSAQHKSELDIEENLRSDHFNVAKTIRHGFPFQPTAMAYDPVQNLLAIGTSTGSLRIFGRPGVDCHIQHEGDVAVTQVLFLVNEGAFVTACTDDNLHLWTLRQKTPTQVHSLKFRNERITYCCLPFQSKWLYVGTQNGNVHIVNIESFVLSGYIINWNKAIELSRKDRPGSVVHLSDNPMDPNKLLIGFDSGIVVLWDLRSKNAEFRYSCNESLTSICWHHEGKMFMCSHGDGSLTTWNVRIPTEPKSNVRPHAKIQKDGKPEPCRPIDKVLWCTVRNGECYMIFSGGMPKDQTIRTPCLTVMHGKSTTVLEMEHSVMDFLSLNATPYDNDFQDPYGIVVLLQNDLVVVDLTTPGYPCFENPYPMDIHESPVTACKYYADCPPDLIPAFYSVGSKQKKTGFSEKEWPIKGGEWGTTTCSYSEIIITGHADGSLKFWDASAVLLQVLYKLKTAKVFDKSRCRSPDADDDPFAVQHIHLCADSRLLCVAGISHVILFKFCKNDATVDCPCLEISIVYEIYDELDSPELEYPPCPPPNSNKPPSLAATSQHHSCGSYGSSNASADYSSPKEIQTCVKTKSGGRKWSAGYQPDLCCCLAWIDGEPPPNITSVSVNSRYGLLGFGNECGLAIVDIIQKTCLLNMGTPDLYGLFDYKFFKRSMSRKSEHRTSRIRSQISYGGGEHNNVFMSPTSPAPPHIMGSMDPYSRVPRSPKSRGPGGSGTGLRPDGLDNLTAGGSNRGFNVDDARSPTGGQRDSGAEQQPAESSSNDSILKESKVKARAPPVPPPPNMALSLIQPSSQFLAHQSSSTKTLAQQASSKSIAPPPPLAQLAAASGSQKNMKSPSATSALHSIEESSPVVPRRKSHYDATAKTKPHNEAAKTKSSPLAKTSQEEFTAVVVCDSSNAGDINEHEEVAITIHKGSDIESLGSSGSCSSLVEALAAAREKKSEETKTAEKKSPDRLGETEKKPKQRRNSLFNMFGKKKDEDETEVAENGKLKLRSTSHTQASGKESDLAAGQIPKYKSAAASVQLSSLSPDMNVNSAAGAAGVSVAGMENVEGNEEDDDEMEAYVSSPTLAMPGGGLGSKGGRRESFSLIRKMSKKIRTIGENKSETGEMSSDDEHLDGAGASRMSRTPSKKPGEKKTARFEVVDMSMEDVPLHPPVKKLLYSQINDKASSADGSFSRSRSSSMSSLENVSKEAIQCLLFADAYTRKSDSSTVPCLWVGTSLGSVLVINLSLPQEIDRKTEPVIVSPSGTIFRLKGAILAMSFLDCKGILIPTVADSWQDPTPQAPPGAGKKPYNRQQSMSAMKSSPTESQGVQERQTDRQFAIMASEKQARVVSLPSQTCAYKVKITDTSIVTVADIISIKDSVCLACYVANGHIITFSLPSLRPLLDIDYLPLTDVRIAKTFCFSTNGHCVYFCSPSEMQKITLSADVSETLNEMLGVLFMPCDTPEAPKKGFLQNLFGGGANTLDREELFGESKGSNWVAKYSAGTAGMSQAMGQAGGACSEISRAKMLALERGQKLGQTEEATEKMRDEAEDFARNAHALSMRYKNKKWYQF